MFGSFSYRRERFVQSVRDKGTPCRRRHLHTAGFHYIAEPPPHPWHFLVDGGLMIVSRLPIVETDFYCYPNGIHADALAAKGVLYAKIDASSRFFENNLECGPDNKKYIHVFCTHLQASYMERQTLVSSVVLPNNTNNSTPEVLTEREMHSRVDKPPKYGEIRRQQLVLLTQFVMEKCLKSSRKIEKDPWVVILGDFNVDARKRPDCGADSDEYQAMMSILNGDYDVLLEKSQSKGLTFTVAPVEGSGVSGHPGEDDYPERSGKSGQSRWIFRDILREQYGTHPVTFGDIEVRVRSGEPPPSYPTSPQNVRERYISPSNNSRKYWWPIADLAKIVYEYTCFSVGTLGRLFTWPFRPHSDIEYPTYNKPIKIRAQGSDPSDPSDVYDPDHLYVIPRETKLTNKDDWCSRQRIDYILVVEPRVAAGVELLTPIVKNVDVEPFFVSGQPMTQCSDHYGVSAALSWR